MRFETSAGAFDLVLNPTNHPALEGHVDNLLQYVLSGRYDGTVINRADEGFVLQMGLFKAPSPEVPETIAGFTRIEEFAPVAGRAGIGLSNTNGTVGLALPAASGGGANHNGGTSSFYINLGNNSFLDSDFTVFAQVADMTTIHSIMALPQIDLTIDPDFGSGPNNLSFTDVPLLPNGDLVIISRAFVVPESSATASLICALAVYVSRRSHRRTLRIS